MAEINKNINDYFGNKMATRLFEVRHRPEKTAVEAALGLHRFHRIFVKQIPKTPDMGLHRFHWVFVKQIPQKFHPIWGCTGFDGGVEAG